MVAFRKIFFVVLFYVNESKLLVEAEAGVEG